MSTRVREISAVADLISRRAAAAGSPGAILVGISGIDASGKGFVTRRLLELLRKRGVNAVQITVDAWLNLPHVRFSAEDPARHFLENALRLDEMFSGTVLPLKVQGSVKTVIDSAKETSNEFSKTVISFENVKVILLEGIFILKRRYRPHFDLSMWIDCGFETAISRAVSRSQEGLGPEETIKAYRRIYFPAQELHFEEDDPVSFADLIFENG